MEQQKNTQKEEISRKEALKKIGKYGKYAALTAIGTYTIPGGLVVGLTVWHAGWLAARPGCGTLSQRLSQQNRWNTS